MIGKIIITIVGTVFVIVAELLFSFIDKFLLPMIYDKKNEIEKARKSYNYEWYHEKKNEIEKEPKSLKLEEEERERQRYAKNLQLIRERDQLKKSMEEERKRQRTLLIIRSKERIF
jgi:cytochrome c-type biogenesis protein CcmH/NrfG